MKLTAKQAQIYLASLGLVLSKKSGEYRVNYRDGIEDAAYYTDDLDDAVGTAEFMLKEAIGVDPFDKEFSGI